MAELSDGITTVTSDGIAAVASNVTTTLALWGTPAPQRCVVPARTEGASNSALYWVGRSDCARAAHASPRGLVRAERANDLGGIGGGLVESMA